MSTITFLFCLLQLFVTANVSQSRHNRTIVWQPMYSLPTEHYSDDQPAANIEGQQTRWPWMKVTTVRQDKAFHTHSLIWRLLSVYAWAQYCTCVRGVNEASMKPTSGPTVPDISDADLSEVTERALWQWIIQKMPEYLHKIIFCCPGKVGDECTMTYSKVCDGMLKLNRARCTGTIY